ncbi:MAG: DUF5067 domain-containing protein [Chloroflexota bacterium]
MIRLFCVALISLFACAAVIGCAAGASEPQKPAGTTSAAPTSAPAAQTAQTNAPAGQSAAPAASPVAQATKAAPPAPTPASNDKLASIPVYDPKAIPADRMQQGQGFVENGTLFIRYIGIEKKDLGGMPGIVLKYEMTNLSAETVDSQTLYVEVFQNGKELKNPFTFEPAYLATPKLEPKKTLAFNDEYLLVNETDPVEAKIRQFLVMTLDPPWVVKTFPLK